MDDELGADVIVLRRRNAELRLGIAATEQQILDVRAALQGADRRVSMLVSTLNATSDMLRDVTRSRDGLAAEVAVLRAELAGLIPSAALVHWLAKLDDATRRETALEDVVRMATRAIADRAEPREIR